MGPPTGLNSSGTCNANGIRFCTAHGTSGYPAHMPLVIKAPRQAAVYGLVASPRKVRGPETGNARSGAAQPARECPLIGKWQRPKVPLYLCLFVVPSLPMFSAWLPLSARRWHVNSRRPVERRAPSGHLGRRRRTLYVSKTEQGELQAYAILRGLKEDSGSIELKRNRGRLAGQRPRPQDP